MADHRSEMADADEAGYLHHARPHPVSLPPLERVKGSARHLTVQLYTIQYPAPAPEQPPRILLAMPGPSGREDELGTITTQTGLDAMVESLRQTIHTLERWRGLLPSSAGP